MGAHTITASSTLRCEASCSFSSAISISSLASCSATPGYTQVRVIAGEYSLEENSYLGSPVLKSLVKCLGLFEKILKNVFQSNYGARLNITSHAEHKH